MDLQELYKWRDIFLAGGKLVELRVLTTGGKETFSGYFYDIEKAIPQLAELEKDQRHNFYFTVNEPKQACSSRIQFNTFKVNPKTTEKVDIERRWWIPIDFDCERPADVASSNEEKEFAHQKAIEVYKFFKSIGWPEPVVNDSSSGYHIYVPCDMENVKAGDRSEVAVKNFLAALQHMFGDDHVKVDQKPCDSCRIMRLPGFYGRKGLNTEERPHRLAKVLLVPKEITTRVTVEQVEAFAARYLPPPQPMTKAPRVYMGQTQPFDLEEFITKHGIQIHNKSTMSDGTTKYVLDHCLFNENHKHPDAAFFVMPNGAISYKCLHDSCSDKTWQDVRLMFEPDAYDKKDSFYQQPMYRKQYFAPKPKYEVKKENKDDGKKWLCTRDVDRHALDNFERIYTGFHNIDRATRGLIFGNITVLAGSNSSGKSAWLNSLILNALEQNCISALWSGEMRKELLVTFLYMVAAGSACKKSNYSEDYYVPDPIADKIDDWMDQRFFLYNNKYGNKWEQLLSDMKEVIQQGAKLLILDNLFSMNIDGFGGDKNTNQKDFVVQLKELAEEHNVHIILVAHPRKVTSFIRKEDISGTSNITDAADNVFLIHRNNNDFQKRAKEFFGEAAFNQKELFKYGNVIEIAKCRMFGDAVDELCGLYYDIPSHQFTNEAGELIEYGWRDYKSKEKPVYGNPNFDSQPQPPVTNDNLFGTNEDVPY